VYIKESRSPMFLDLLFAERGYGGYIRGEGISKFFLL
jgi:hypothetical protein